MIGARRLVLSTADRASLERWADAALPEECCGILVGRLRGEETVVEGVRAAANVSHQDRRQSFALDPLAVLEAGVAARAVGLDLVGFFHSHPDGVVRPSSRDRAGLWPGTSCVIVSPGGRIASWHRLSDGSLASEAITLGPPARERS